MNRILYSPPPQAPKKVFEQGREGYTPYQCRWDDGSYYMAWTTDYGRLERIYGGPMFKDAED